LVGAATIGYGSLMEHDSDRLEELEAAKQKALETIDELADESPKAQAAKALIEQIGLPERPTRKELRGRP